MQQWPISDWDALGANGSIPTLYALKPQKTKRVPLPLTNGRSRELLPLLA